MNAVHLLLLVSIATSSIALAQKNETCYWDFTKYASSEVDTGLCESPVSKTEIIVDGECHNSSEFGFYRAACDVVNGGSQIYFLDVYCELDDCNDCRDSVAGDPSSFIQSGHGYRRGCHSSTVIQDVNTFSYDFLGICDTGSCFVVPPTPSGAPSEVTEERGEEVDDSSQEIAPIVEDPDACSFQLEYYGAANSITAICDDIIQNETNVIADGECNFDPLIGYYRAACSTNGGSKLIFLDANCENGCSNCFSRDTSDNFFIESGDVYSVGCHYIENTGVQDAIAHSFTVAGSCSSDLSCQVQSASETNTVAGAHTPNDLKNDSSGRSYTPSFANAVLCIAFWVYVAAFR